MKSEGCCLFSWQPGYGAFSVSQSNIDVIKKYIQSQKKHHKRLTFQEEVKEFMRKYEIDDFNEEYFWK